MLLTILIQTIFLNIFLKNNDIKNRKVLLIYSVWMSTIIILLLWRIFNLREFNNNTIFLISLSVNRLNTVLTFFGSLFVFNVIQFYINFKTSRLFEMYQQSKIKQTLMLFVLLVPVFFGSLLFFSSHWAVKSFGNLEFDQIIYMLNAPITGTDIQQIINYVYSPILNAIFITSIFASIYYLFSTYKIRFSKMSKKNRYIALAMASLVVFLLSTGLSIQKIGYADIKSYYFEKTTLYEEYFVDTENVSLTFPEEKRNLIYIFLESMESSYASQDLGGIKQNNLIPNLTKLALEEGIHFSDKETLGGMKYLTGAGATASSMVAQTSGIPLIASSESLNTNDYGSKGQDFLPGAYSLGEVLDKEGYNQMLFIGSEGEFAGRNKYFEQHGNYEIRDYNWAKKEGLIPEDYRVWWGYEDRKLFEFAKESLLELSNQEEPFNFTMLTTDTHFEDGYLTEETPDLFGDQYSNVIHSNDRQVMEFLTWIKEQDFYDNTTVVIVGDHLTMDVDFFVNDNPEYSRTVYNVFLNSQNKVNNQKNRIFTAVDMFPTTLASLGVEIEGNRLALGTNLFSDEQTLAEKLTYETLLEELKKKSPFYSRYIMQGTDVKLLYEDTK